MSIGGVQSAIDSQAFIALMLLQNNVEAAQTAVQNASVMTDAEGDPNLGSLVDVIA